MSTVLNMVINVSFNLNFNPVLLIGHFNLFSQSVIDVSRIPLHCGEARTSKRGWGKSCAVLVGMWEKCISSSLSSLESKHYIWYFTVLFHFCAKLTGWKYLHILLLNGFHFKCQKLIGFASAALHYWLRKLAAIFHWSKSKTNRNSCAQAFPLFSSATCASAEFWLAYSVDCLRLLRLVEEFALVLVLRYSNIRQLPKKTILSSKKENNSITFFPLH